MEPTFRLKYVKLSPDTLLGFVRTLTNLPADAKILNKMAFDTETGHMVCFVESATFPEVAGPDDIVELPLL